MLDPGLRNGVALSRFALVRVIGQTGSVRTMLMRDNITSQQYVAKEVNLANDSRVDQFIEKAKRIEKLSHPSLVSLLAVSGSVLFYDFYENGSVEDHMTDLSPLEKMKIVYGVASGLSYLHQSGIIHRNLKLDKVLLDECRSPVLTGFGFSETLSDPREYAYAAPEVLENEDYGYGDSVDVWAFGMFVIELLTGHASSVVPDSFPEGLKALLRKCLAKAPEERTSFREILSDFETKECFVEGCDEAAFRKYVRSVAPLASRCYGSVSARLPPLPPKAYQSARPTSSQHVGIIGKLEKKTNPRQRAVSQARELPKLRNGALTKREKKPYFGPHQKTKFEKLQENAKEDDAESHFHLGVAYQEGNEKEGPNYIMSAKHFKKAAKLGHVEAQYRLGMMFFEGKGATKDLKKAVYYVRRAGQGGHLQGEFMYSKMLMDGQGVPANIPKAMKHLQHAAAKKNVNAQFLYAKYLEEGILVGQDLPQALRFYSKAAKAGHVEAQYRAGKMYLYGVGVRKQLKKAAEYFFMAAQQKSPCGLSAYAYMLENGFGIHQDRALAAKFYKKAAKRRDIFGENAYGRILCAGVLVKQDYQEAFQLFKNAADRGDASAKNNLGRMYESGLGVAKDLRKAVELYQEASDKGEIMATVNLGIMYETGRGVPKDVKRAVQLFCDAAKSGQAEGQLQYGRVLENGIGIGRNATEAAKQYRLAAGQGNATAQYCYGRLCELGTGTERDIPSAIRFYTMASQQGLKKATRALERLHASGQ